MASEDDVIDELVSEYRETLERWRYDGFDATLTASPEETTRGTFRGLHELTFDEPPYNMVSEGDNHPCPHDYLIAAVAGCQIEILQQCLEKAGIDDYWINLDITSEKGESDVDDGIPGYAGMRITDTHTEVSVEVPEEYEARASRCVEVFERNCPISQSVQAGVELHTEAETVVKD